MGLRYAPDADTDFREIRERIAEDRNVVVVTCPHPNCEQVANTTAPDAGTELTVTRSAALFGDYERVRCPEGHKVFVHRCETPQ